VSRNGWVFCLFLVSGCSEGTLRTGSISLIAADSLDLPDPEEPRVLLRCEQGRVDAYLVVGTAAEAEAGAIDERAVRIDLDTALFCSDSAP
jgi:hypothetical protein